MNLLNLCLLLMASLIALSHSFSMNHHKSWRRNNALSMGVLTDPVKKINGVVITPSLLRSVGPLISQRGERVKLGDVMGNGKSIVVFLRHLG